MDKNIKDKEERMKIECKHYSVCNAGDGKKRCTRCDKIISQAEIDTKHSKAGERI